MEPRGGARPRETTVAYRPGWLALNRQPVSIRSVLGRLVAGQRRRLVLVAVVSFLGGLAEALVLAIIAKLAFAIARTTARSTSRSPRSTSMSRLPNWSSSPCCSRSFVSAIKRSAIWESTKLATQAISKGRTDAVRLFLGASWALQADERRGQLQEMTTTQVAQTSSVLNCSRELLVSTVNVWSLYSGAALFANVWATLAATFIVVLLALFLRPLRNRIRRRSSMTAAANAEFAASISELSEISREVRVFGVRSRSRGGDRRPRSTNINGRTSRPRCSPVCSRPPTKAWRCF